VTKTWVEKRFYKAVACFPGGGDLVRLFPANHVGYEQMLDWKEDTRSIGAYYVTYALEIWRIKKGECDSRPGCAHKVYAHEQQ
jgi:hypothetical protein